MKKTKFPWPYHIDEETKIVSVYVVSGWPSVMMIPKKVEEYFPGYKGEVVSKEYFDRLSANEPSLVDLPNPLPSETQEQE